MSSNRNILKNRLFTIGKLLMGLTLLLFLIARVDTNALFAQLGSVNLYYLTIVFILPHLGILLSTIKWQILLSALGIDASTRRLFGFYMIGTFFNNFLPTMVGGDVVKAYMLNRESEDGASVISATFMERYIGLAALITLLPLILLRKVVMDRYPMLGLLVIFILAIYGVSVALLFRKMPMDKPKHQNVIKVFVKFWNLLEKIRWRVANFRNFRRKMLISYVISLFFYVVTAGCTWAATRCVGADVDYTYLLAIVPVVLLAGLIPISLNGLGITETGYVIFLSLVDIPAVDAIAAALILRGRVLVTAILGGVIFLFYRKNRRWEGNLAAISQLEVKDKYNVNSSKVKRI